MRIIPSVAMFPSAVTALTGAGRSQSPERAGRERARLGERESESARGARAERGRRGRRPSAPRPARVRGRAPSARVRGGDGGAESGRGTPTSGRRRRAAGGRGTRWLPRETARRRRSEAAETRAALRSARPSAASRQETGGKGEHKLPRLRGWTRARGGATPRIVELVESEGRSERSVAKCWEREGAGPAQTGPGNAPGRASSAGLARRTRSECARDTNAGSAEPQTEAIPCRARLLVVCQRLRPALGATEPALPKEKRKGSREPGGAFETCVSGTTPITVTARGERGRRYPIRPHLPACFFSRLDLPEDFPTPRLYLQEDPHYRSLGACGRNNRLEK